MKYFFITIIFSLMCFSGVMAQQAADTILPPDIATDFKSRYNTEPADWVKSGENYQITFLKDNKWYEVSYSSKAKMLGLNILISYDDLPDPVKKSFDASAYGTFDIQKILEIQTADQKKNFRIIVVNPNEDEITVTYNEAGGLIK